MAQKKTSLAWKILIGVLVAFLVLILLAEFGLRWFMGNQMKDQFAQAAKDQGIESQEDPNISFGTTPILLGLFGGKLSEMNMETPSTLQIDGTEIKGQPATNVHIEDMTLSDDPVAGSLRASTKVPDDYLLATFQKGIADESGSEQVGNLVVTNITANDAENLLDVEFAGGLANLALEPKAQDGNLSITAKNASLLGFDLPKEATDAISTALQKGMKDQFIGEGLSVDEVDVADGELNLTITGQDVPMSELGSAANAAGKGAKEGAPAPAQQGR
ncbi:hypothetical protein HMPREF3155_02510 [Corynebacterium sp. HMSC06D04]|uniref:DUF2993 domain-containing protein n=1 Tax=Corynebacterium simulans TaxID=146827 RepID=A0ABR5VEZ2_9CORY|nr:MULTISPECIES: DUF2993 domain-containing protein [Corynebacterium]KXU19110.1 hypothetical protein WM41_0220 [Corynebacterium simulans]OFL98860.1 hypothetical protein HMPREF2724_12045 [Corynebacterium sp. HMSC071F07]OFQ46585.1 hypothetical protein HMPREF2935_04460 [Corynebacterium sp. HMSC076D02]OFR39657.1 hypothetical protein HMPREF2888_07780 [Corynebacterium sp. HMSC077D03]OFT32106.1 hypothetical protein HMPREF3169_11685 [Corynebacterium sp. HMSC08C04]